MIHNFLKINLPFAGSLIIFTALVISVSMIFTLPGSAKAEDAVTIDEFWTTTANSQPVDITTGPDGNLWFTKNNSFSAGDKIGKITPQGSSA